MFGKQLERVQKRARDLKDEVEANRLLEKNLLSRLQDELAHFLEQHSDAKHVEVSHPWTIIIYLPQRVKIENTNNTDDVAVLVNGSRRSTYYCDTQRFFASVGSAPLTDYVQKQVQHIFGVILPAWDSAVATRDFEAFECARTLRWIAQQLPRNTQWPDIITGNFPIK